MEPTVFLGTPFRWHNLPNTIAAVSFTVGVAGIVVRHFIEDTTEYHVTSGAIGVAFTVTILSLGARRLFPNLFRPVLHTD